MALEYQPFCDASLSGRIKVARATTVAALARKILAARN